jgi:hypothetical protein
MKLKTMLGIMLPIGFVTLSLPIVLSSCTDSGTPPTRTLKLNDYFDLATTNQIDDTILGFKETFDVKTIPENYFLNFYDQGIRYIRDQDGFGLSPCKDWQGPPKDNHDIISIF